MKCKEITIKGTRCQMYALKGEDFCFNHHPDISAQEKREARSKAGKANKIQPYKLPDIKLMKAQDVPNVLIDTIHRVRANKLDLKVATTIGTLCLNLVKAFDVSDHAKRIEAIEYAINNENNNNNFNIIPINEQAEN